jgi:hypothetical protein
MVYFNTTYLNQVFTNSKQFVNKMRNPIWLLGPQNITSSFFDCKFFNVAKRFEVKTPLYLIVMGFLGVLRNEIN